MSAIAKPFLQSTSATNTNTLVNVEFVVSAEKMNSQIQAAANTAAAAVDYQIVFALTDSADQQRKTIVWSYTTAALRDTAFSAVITAIASVVA